MGTFHKNFLFYNMLFFPQFALTDGLQMGLLLCKTHSSLEDIIGKSHSFLFFPQWEKNCGVWDASQMLAYGWYHQKCNTWQPWCGLLGGCSWKINNPLSCTEPHILLLFYPIMISSLSMLQIVKWVLNSSSM